MEDWNFNFTVISATNLPVVRNFSKMRVYAEVSINGDPNLSWKTPVDKAGGTNPRWNCQTPYKLPARYLEREDMLAIKLYSERSFKYDKYVGEVNLSLKKLFDNRESQDVHEDCNVNRVNENGHFGVLKISYNFREKISEPEKVIVEQVGQGSGEGSSFLSGIVQIGTPIILSIVLDSVLPGAGSVFLG